MVEEAEPKLRREVFVALPAGACAHGRVEEAEPKLRRDVFVALAAVPWADGTLDPDEADAIVRAAVDEGLSLEEIAEIESATQAPVDLGALDRTGLGKE